MEPAVRTSTDAENILTIVLDVPGKTVKHLHATAYRDSRDDSAVARREAPGQDVRCGSTRREKSARVENIFRGPRHG
jgi:hypothetical protein